MQSLHVFRLSHATASTPGDTPARLEGLVVTGQVVRIRSRSSHLAFIDLRTQNPSCLCCAKSTVVARADSLLTKNISSFRKGRIKLGDVVRVTGFAEMVPNSDWFDPCDGILLAEARIIATEDCFMVERFVGRGFEEEKPVRKVPVSTEKTMKEAICKFYINSGGKCPLGDACDFYHPPLGQIPVIRKGWLAERLEKRLKNATQDWPDPIEMSLKQPHSARASVFADWILQEFGELDLNSGSGVYDIAGGSGKLSLELIDRGIEKCTVVDSRDFSMGFAMKRWIKKRQTSSRTAGPDEFSDREADSDDEEIEHELLVETSESPRMGNRGQPVGELNLPFIYRQQFFTPDKITPDMHYASLFVGLHPDQATGAIVEVAIQLNKSFAVIPCCVFKDDFNERKLRNGKQVCTTLELIEWIKEKRPDGEVGTCFLDFQGKNLVVYNKMKG